MTCGLQEKNSLFTLFVTCAYRMHIQDGGMHAAFDQNKSISFENQTRYEILNYKGSLYIILNVLSNKTNLIYIAISL
jgi:hypothetical protein